MLIKIFEDTHDIIQRLREINNSYFVVYNTERECFEIHNSGQKNTFCLTVPFPCLDCRAVDLTLKTRRENIDKILNEIDRDNDRIDEQNKKAVRNLSEWKLKEYYSYANGHEEKNIANAYVTKWV